MVTAPSSELAPPLGVGAGVAEPLHLPLVWAVPAAVGPVAVVRSRTCGESTAMNREPARPPGESPLSLISTAFLPLMVWVPPLLTVPC